VKGGERVRVARKARSMPARRALSCATLCRHRRRCLHRAPARSHPATSDNARCSRRDRDTRSGRGTRATRERRSRPFPCTRSDPYSSPCQHRHRRPRSTPEPLPSSCSRRPLSSVHIPSRGRAPPSPPSRTPRNARRLPWTNLEHGRRASCKAFEPSRNRTAGVRATRGPLTESRARLWFSPLHTVLPSGAIGFDVGTEGQSACGGARPTRKSGRTNCER